MMRWSRSKILSALLATVYVVIMMIPNCVLAFTEPWPAWCIATSIILPLGFYLWWCVLLRRSGVTIWLSFPFIFFGAFQIVLLYLFGNSIVATDMFTNLLTTNPGEAGELLANIWPAVLIVFAIYLPLLWVATRELRYKRAIPIRLRKLYGGAGLLLFILGLGMLIPCSRRYEGSVLKECIFPVNVFYNLKLSVSEYYKVMRFEELSSGFSYEAERTDSLPEREIYLFIIGEASRASNWQLYGYGRETTPQLCATEDLLCFGNILTQSNTTHKSVPMILSSVDTDEHAKIYHRKGIPALFSEAGFHTSFISNQAPQGAMVDKLAADANTLHYIGAPRFDLQMLDEMKRQIENSDPEKDLFFILHCYGSHFSYHQRYPRDFARWLPDDDVAITHKNIEMIRNAYDNSILYTDHFLHEVIEYLRSLEGCCSAMLYCADHGEDLLDDKRDRFLHASPTTTYYQLHVASVAWFSDLYEKHYPEKVAAAWANHMAPATTHSLFHTLADMASIQSPYLDREVSLLNAAFDHERPRYYLDDHNLARPFSKVGINELDQAIFRRRGMEVE